MVERELPQPELIDKFIALMRVGLAAVPLPVGRSRRRGTLSSLLRWHVGEKHGYPNPPSANHPHRLDRWLPG